MTELKIKQKCEDMIKYGLQSLNQYPRSEKYGMGAVTKAVMYELLKLIISCNHKYYKKTTLQDMDVQLDILRTFIRLAMELGYLPFKKYEVWSAKVDEIGRMIGGWRKTVVLQQK